MVRNFHVHYKSCTRYRSHTRYGRNTRSCLTRVLRDRSCPDRKSRRVDLKLCKHAARCLTGVRRCGPPAWCTGDPVVVVSKELRFVQSWATSQSSYAQDCWWAKNCMRLRRVTCFRKVPLGATTTHFIITFIFITTWFNSILGRDTRLPTSCICDGVTPDAVDQSLP